MEERSWILWKYRVWNESKDMREKERKKKEENRKEKKMKEERVSGWFIESLLLVDSGTRNVRGTAG